MVEDSEVLLLLSTVGDEGTASLSRVLVQVLPHERGATAKACAVVIAKRYQLTAQQTKVLERILLGESNATIAKRLGIAASTVKTHTKAILQQTGRRNKLALMGLLFDIAQRATELDEEPA